MSTDPLLIGAAVVGAGPAGVQCALILRRLGADVLLIGSEHPSRRLASLPRERGWNTNDLADEVSLRVHEDNIVGLAEFGVPVLEETVLELARHQGGWKLATRDRSLQARAVVLATGAAGARGDRRAVLPGNESFDLDMHEDGMVEVEAGFGTSCSGLFAIGDLAGGMRQSVSCALGTGSRAAWSVWRAFAWPSV